MLFFSEEFLFLFLPIVLGIYYICLRKILLAKNLFLFGVSIFFYAWGEPKYVWIMLTIIVTSWIFGLLIDRYRSQAKLANLILILMVIVDIGILFWFKYSIFVAENFNRLFETKIQVPEVVLPIGISFFTFQAISYVVDVYREKGKVQKNPFYVGLYISLFPQLIAGPIVRYETVAEEIYKRTETFKGFSRGVCRFIIGLGKKILLSNTIGLVADVAFELVRDGEFQASMLMAWIGAISFTLQIFFDFAGYSDMAIGLGLMFGFHFKENFKYPYTAKSISQFWQRWHISLQTWFRDYIYFPLGGSRVKTKARLIFNLMVVWLLTGIWHGANWTFFVWGVLYFMLITIEKLIGFSKNEKWYGHIYTMFFVIIGWVIFRSPSISTAFIYIKALFGINTWGFVDAGALAFLNQNKWFYLAALICCLPIIQKLDIKYRRKYVLWNYGYIVAIISILLVSISYIFNYSYNPFIYFNF